MIKQEELERTFKSYIKSPYVLGLVMMHLIYTTLVTLVVFSFVLFIIFFLLLFSQVYIGWRAWKQGWEYEKYRRLMNLFLFFNLGISLLMPFFFVYFGTLYFWAGLIFYLSYVIFLFSKAKVIADGMYKPSESKIWKIYLVSIVIIGFIGIPGYYMPSSGLFLDLMSEEVKDIYYPEVLYLMGLVLTFLLPILLYPKKTEVEEQPQGRKKLSRANRKALKKRESVQVRK